jgi:hypothetical protein
MEKFIIIFAVVLLIFVIFITVVPMCGGTHYDDENFFGEIGPLQRASRIEATRELLKEIGLAKDVVLMELGRDHLMKGIFSGGFLTGTNGKIASYSSVTFRWKCNDGRIFYSELPMSKVAIRKSEVDYQKIHFIFEIIPHEYISWWKSDFTGFRKRPSDLMEYVFLATITISEKNIEKYLALK